jgi:putative transposase
MIMQLAERIFVKENPAMADLCRKQTMVYNQSIWYLRQEYFNNDDAGQGFLSYYDLNDKSMLRWKDCYRDAIPSCAANTIARASSSWKAYWASLKRYSKDKSGYTGKPKMPGYTMRGEKSPVYFTYTEFVIKDHRVIFPKATGFEPVHVPRLNDQKRSDSSAPVKQVRVIPALAGGYWIECVYNMDEKPADVDPLRMMGIDLGMRYLAVIVDNLGTQPEAINAAPVREVNQWYAKELARLKAEKERCTPRMAELQRKKESGLDQNEWIEFWTLLKDTKQMKLVAEKRNRRVAAFFHKVSCYIIAEAVKRSVGTIVVGHNPGQKQRIDIGRRNNQSFTLLPIFKFIGSLMYKSALVGITVEEVTEEYTSKASFRDNDPFDGSVISGTRKHRGLYIDGCGNEIHADVNGAYNILRKKCPEAFGLKGAATRPWPVILNMTSH